MKLEYELIRKGEFSNHHGNVLSQMLNEQGKVQCDTKKKIDRCETICIATWNSEDVAIGAIKKKTLSDFSEHKACVPSLDDQIDWELGYLYTKQEHEGKGIGSTVVRLLLHHHKKDNLMASTEISKNAGMVNILEKNGFRLFGNPWKSNIHDNFLGLFLKFQ